MEFNPLERKPQSASQEILGIMQEVSALGTNDHEMEALQDVFEKHRNNEYSGQEAIEAARRIRDSKHDDR